MRQRTERERLECEKMKEAMGKWIAENNFTLFGTATYVHPINVKIEKAHRDAAHFARILSREILGKHLVDRQNTYLPMMMFVERGKQRDNTHLHFFTKGYTLKHTKQIITLADKIWKKRIDYSLDVLIKDEHEAQRRTYTMKEQLALDDDIISPKACFLPTNPQYRHIVQGL
jgi:hypothetical protein